jgi:hypothetical protein
MRGLTPNECETLRLSVGPADVTVELPDNLVACAVELTRRGLLRHWTDRGVFGLTDYWEATSLGRAILKACTEGVAA